MSTRIGGVHLPGLSDDLDVYASEGGVELHTAISASMRSLTPCEARNLAALLTRGADETARMQEKRGDIGALVEALIWCSGADDFQEGGKAREGFLRVVQPYLNYFTPRRRG